MRHLINLNNGDYGFNFDEYMEPIIEDYFGQNYIETWKINKSKAIEIKQLEGYIINDQFKYLAIQIKKSSFSNKSSPKYSNLKWSLTKQNGLFEATKNSDFIYYCLHLYNNPYLNNDCLNNSIFWRPSKYHNPTNYWYNNESIGEKNGALKKLGYRWDELIESIVSVKKPIKTRNDDFEIIKGLYKFYFDDLYLIAFKSI